MNKRDLIKTIAKHTGLSIRKTRKVIDCIVQNISYTLKQGDKVSLRDFASFCCVEKDAKRYYDISTGEVKSSTARKVVKFVPYKKFKEQLSSKIIDIHDENDGSIGNSLTIEQKVYSVSQHPFTRKVVNDVGLQPILGKKNTGKRVEHKTDSKTIELSFDSNFIFDHFLGESEHEKFPSLKVPRKETPILVPQVDNIGSTIGVMEPVLLAQLYNMCKEIKGIKVLKNVKLPILNRNYSYRPDFCLYWERKKLYIDIEIDEPYDIVSHNPIHYKGNGDNLRDRYFIRNGWCVLRFAEQQIVDNIEGTINYVKRVLAWLTDENGIKIHNNTLKEINRWSYEEATKMSSDNVRENYLKLPHYDNPSFIINDNRDLSFQKPADDILPQEINQKEQDLSLIVNDIKKSNIEYCILTTTNEYQWIYISKSLTISYENGCYVLKGQSPFNIEMDALLEEIKEISPLKELFSEVSLDCSSDKSRNTLSDLRKILFDAIAKGKPIWIDYTSSSGRSTRFLCNLIYNWGNTYDTPHIGLGYCKKNIDLFLGYFHGYCSKRKEFRQFAADDRIKEIRVLNCEHVYLCNNIYESGFKALVTSPYNVKNGWNFFENADEILHIMPQFELDSDIVKANIANLLVMKGEIDEAVAAYQQTPYNHLLTPSLRWGEVCLCYIHNLINLFKEHLNDRNFHPGLEANRIMNNFEKVLTILTESSWMRD